MVADYLEDIGATYRDVKLSALEYVVQTMSNWPKSKAVAKKTVQSTPLRSRLFWEIWEAGGLETLIRAF